MTEPVKLFVIGSCRVHKPINNLAKAGIISLPKCEICNRNCEGTLYCHSSNEIIQYLVFAKKQAEDINAIPPEIAKLISIPSNFICPGTLKYVRQKFIEAKLIVIEVSSIKNIIYWEKAFPFYLNLVKYKQAQPELAKSVQVAMEEYTELIENLESILVIIPENVKILFVSHINPGQTIGNRTLIEMAIEYVTQKYSGIMHLNPTIFVDQLGGLENATLPGKETEYNPQMLALVQEYIASWIILS